MKKSLKPTLLALTVLTMLVWACSQNGERVIPEDLEAKKEMLAETQAELRELQILVIQLQTEIRELEPDKNREPIEVDTKLITRDSFQSYVVVQANIEADEVVNASSEIGGRLTRVFVDEGDKVRRGALVATTDVSTVQDQINEIQTSLDLATTIYQRQKRLWDQNIGSEIQYLEAKNRKESLEKSLATLQTQLNKKNIYAPIAGVVDQKFLNAGEMVSPGMPVVQILDTDKVKIKADVQESLLGKVKAGDRVKIYFPALDLSINEDITAIGRKIDLNNRTFEIEIATSSRNGRLKPNLLAEVKISDYTHPNAIIIPLAAIKEEVSGNKYVYLAREEDGISRAEKSYVTLGKGDLGNVVIEEGIEEGDQLVVAGGENLSDNDPLLINRETSENNGQ